MGDDSMIEAPGERARRRSRIPAGQIERLGRIGWMAGEVAVGGILERARRLAAGPQGAAGSVLLTATNARRLARRLSSMRGAAMKLGQLLSLEGDDFLPPEFAEALAVLRKDADAMPHAQLEGVLAAAYGADWRGRFREIDLEPVAAASIGQVHYAVAPDGRELALKIQYPGVARSIESDVDNLATALRLARLLPGDLDLSGVIAEAKAQLRDEADYLGEAERLRRYRALAGGDPDLAVPAVHDELTRPDVLAMDYLHGVPLEELCAPGTPQSTRDRVGALLYRLLFRELFSFRFVQSDPNLANYLWLPDTRRVGLLDLGAGREIPERLSRLYARMFLAAVAGRQDELTTVAREVGFFAEDERADRAEGVVELLRLGCEPFAARGAYDFAASSLPARLREHGLELTFRRGFLRPPPPGTLFLHRKLGGVFLLCARLRARVDARRLLAETLDGARADAS